jgi:NAD(P)-dependent dehydrogenase (short-subunit alcohol dehydrogenase family)
VRSEVEYKKWISKGVVPVYIDVSNTKQILEAAEIIRIHLEERKLDLVGIINNAGSISISTYNSSSKGYAAFGPIETFSMEEVRKHFETNLFGK